MTEPIIVPCEGSGCPVHDPLFLFGTCAMCGRLVHHAQGNAVAHERQDIIAMLERGDFDE